MKYKISEIAKISGVSSRTLRYYDEIGVLKPSKIDDNGYRVYTDEEVDKLQMILFYRGVGMPLEDIKKLASSETFCSLGALESHLNNLIEKKDTIEKMILKVTQTINLQKVGNKMSKNEKFKGLEAIAQNESKYGEELKEKFGDATISASFEKIRKSGIERIEMATEELNQSLIAAFETKDPASMEAQMACENHKKLLLMTWDEGMYSKENQCSLVQGFIDDERFRSYYENLGKGMMDFFCEATKIYCK